jgi:parvulin-like peptidyl-prolyl isomerase
MPCESAQILVRLPNDVVLTSDVVAVTNIDDLLARNKDKNDKTSDAEAVKQRAEIIREAQAGIGQLVAHLGDPDPGSFVDPPRRALIQQLLHQQIERKLIYQDFLLNGPPKEALPGIEQMIDREFDRMQLPKLLKRENAVARQDLEWKLRAQGSSLERERRMFMEEVVSEQWMRDKVKDDKGEDPTHEQLLSWYQAHLQEFEKPARARWDELMVSFSKYNSSGEAYAAIAQMGNQVVLFGVPLAEVARARSDGPTADQGGRRDWTTKGSLVSEELDRALFTLPPKQYSPIIETKAGYHIIRVVERQEAHRVPFLEAQKEIAKKIQQERTSKKYREYLVDIQKKFPVWTIFDATARRTTPARPDDASRY